MTFADSAKTFSTLTLVFRDDGFKLLEFLVEELVVGVDGVAQSHILFRSHVQLHDDLLDGDDHIAISHVYLLGGSAAGGRGEENKHTTSIIYHVSTVHPPGYTCMPMLIKPIYTIAMYS